MSWNNESVILIFIILHLYFLIQNANLLCIYILSLKQNINFPTHIHSNCLELILTHEDSSIIKYTIPSDIIADYFATICKLNMFKVNTDSSIIYYRNIKSIDLDLFSSIISEYISINNIDISYFNDTLSEVLDTFAPLNKQNYSLIYLLLGIILHYLI